MKLTVLPIDTETLLEGALLISVMPVFSYKDGKRTDDIEAHRYVCTLPGAEYEKLGVKIPGDKALIEVADKAIPVSFKDAEARIYYANGSYDLTVSAKGITRVGGLGKS